MYKRRTGLVRALEDVSFSVEEFSTLGIVGESGSGKTTLAKIVARLIAPTKGTVEFDSGRINNFRKDVQVIFQNPYASLDPKMRIKDALYEPLLIHRLAAPRQLRDKALELLDIVGMGEDALGRFPAEFSGGQRQRICIARALATQPKCIILDEPISSLDLTIQLKLLDLLLRVKEEFRLTYLFISHNLSVIKYMADSVIVLKEGRIVEQGGMHELFSHPSHPYTQNLLRSARR
ncbi:MAG: ATP-binding cassette domain-containing protein [Candidatus Omnitrophota bacterium]